MYNKSPATIETWANNDYPIKDKEKLLETFSLSLKEIYSNPEIQNQVASQEEYNSIYNKVMLNPIFDSHPLEFIWREKDEDFLSDLPEIIFPPTKCSINFMNTIF